MIKLVKPSNKYEESYLDALREFRDENSEEGKDFLLDGSNFDDMMKKYESYSQGKNLPDGYVPASEFWLVDDEQFIGRLSIRHKLNERLKKIGGHIGYAIRPSLRKKGYGTRILELGKKEAKKLGIEKALMTCKDWNIGSRKIIEKNGGIFLDRATIEDGVIELRFWVNI